MDKLLNAIKCHHCQKILSTPIILPCGHSMCKVHADVAGDQVKCARCGILHQNREFMIILELLEVIDSQIGSMDFGPCHKEAKEACNRLEDVLDQIDAILKDPIFFSHKAIDELKNQVLLKSEKLKLEIDENTQNLLTLLSEYQKSCEVNLKESNLCLNSLENMKQETEKMLNESLVFLNKFKVDDERWRTIKHTCECKINDVNQELECAKKLIFINEFEEKTAQVDFFKDVDLNQLFRWELVWINSSILEGEQKTQLRDLCKISPETKWKLLYRGSRDGFGANEFHSKCDKKLKTFTIIKTVLGHIFGGFTKQPWDCPSPSGSYARDPNAYIFSLVNELNSSFVLKVKNPNEAIGRDRKYGPLFGYGDICICDYSNSSMNGRAKVYSYYPPECFKNNPFILAGSLDFQVQEIEVFQLE